MINQINQNAQYKNIFAPIRSDGALYPISKPFTEVQKTEIKNEEQKKESKVGRKIVKITLLTALGLIIVIKGAPKGVRKKFDSFLLKLDDKITGLNEQKHTLSNFQLFYLSALKKAKTAIGYSKAAFNTAPLKDVLVTKALKKFPKLKQNVADKITDFFERISVKMVDGSYIKTAGKVDKMYANFAETNKKYAIPDDSLKKINANIEEIQKTFNEGFSKKARNDRLVKIKTGLESIDEKIWDETYRNPNKLLSNKKIYTTFLSEDLAAKTKAKIINDVNIIRGVITTDIDDFYNSTRKIIDQINNIIEPDDKDFKSEMQNIKHKLYIYKESVDKGKKNKEIVLNDKFIASLNELKLRIKNSNKYDPKTIAEISEYMENLCTMVDKNPKGAIQNILYEYKKYLPNKDYRKLKKDTYKAIDSLHKSINDETDLLFDKIRDLKIGSAPTDVLGVIVSSAVVGWGLSKSENKEERISVGLKYGVPVIGGLLVTLYCTLGLISGGAAIMIGTASGFAINKLGSYLDKKRKEYKEKQPNILTPSKVISKINEKTKSI